MYSPRHFAELDRTVLRDEIRKIRAGHLITLGSEGLEASFIPLLISDDAGMITGHLAKGNEQWRHADTSVPALITWIGPDAYVPPATTHRNVSIKKSSQRGTTSPFRRRGS